MLGDQLEQSGQARGAEYCLVAGIGYAENQVLPQCAADQAQILGKIADHFAHHGRVQRGQVHAAEKQLALLRPK